MPRTVRFPPSTDPEAGVTEPHHSVSHHNNNPSKLAAMALIGKYYTQHLARLVDKLGANDRTHAAIIGIRRGIIE